MTYAMEMKENDAVVRIWKSENHSERKFGHVSLETKEHYMSFWPTNGRNSKGALMIRLKSDEEAEYGQCDAIYTLNSNSLNKDLSIYRINSCFEDFLSHNGISVMQWNAYKIDNRIKNKLVNTIWSTDGVIGNVQQWGGNTVNFYEHPQSCVTFTWNLLAAGGGGFNIENFEISQLFGGLQNGQSVAITVGAFEDKIKRMIGSDETCSVS